MKKMFKDMKDAHIQERNKNERKKKTKTCRGDETLATTALKPPPKRTTKEIL